MAPAYTAMIAELSIEITTNRDHPCWIPIQAGSATNGAACSMSPPLFPLTPEPLSGQQSVIIVGFENGTCTPCRSGPTTSTSWSQTREYHRNEQ
jgi:hypothetical protein